MIRNYEIFLDNNHNHHGDMAAHRMAPHRKELEYNYILDNKFLPLQDNKHLDDIDYNDNSVYLHDVYVYGVYVQEIYD